MAPHEWAWADDDEYIGVAADAEKPLMRSQLSSIRNWLTTPLERAFERQCRLNGPVFPNELAKGRRGAVAAFSRSTSSMDSGSVTVAGARPALRKRSSFISQTQPHSVQLQLNKIDESSPAAITAVDPRVRQSSAPPVMSTRSEAGSAVKEATHESHMPVAKGTHSSTGEPAKLAAEIASKDGSVPQVPPSVLKAQLLSVLRHRLGDAAKAGSAPLRMKKFVVWNGKPTLYTLSEM